jgi:RHS repeat-associated protein
VELDHDGLGTGDDAFVIARYEYNPLHWRTVKVADVRAPSSNPTTEPSRLQRRVMYYNASWQLIEEHICDDWDLSLGGDVNRIGQYFWGLRYIDDFIYRQEDRDLTNADPMTDPAEPDFDPAETGSWYALTDVQFSVVALMTPEARIAERVVYDPYGRGRHYFPSDYNGDTVANVTDQNAHFSGWTADNLSGDWTRDNDCDVPDIFSYLTDFFAYLNKDAGAGQISFRYVPGTSAGPDNQIGYCGYVFNPETDDYTVRFRHYDPEIGRWLERDPAGYVDGSSLYEYAMSEPVDQIDPFGDRITVGGDEKFRKAVQDALRKLCPDAKVNADGSITLPPRPEPPKDEAKSEKCNTDCANPPGCEILRMLDEHGDEIPIKKGGNPTTTFQPDGDKRSRRVWIGIVHNPEFNEMIQRRDKKGRLVNDRRAEAWEALWHELIHAERIVRKMRGMPGGHHYAHKRDKPTTLEKGMEEVETIKHMNELREWYHNCVTKGNSHPWPPFRDPLGHPLTTPDWKELEKKFPGLQRGWPQEWQVPADPKKKVPKKKSEPKPTN